MKAMVDGIKTVLLEDAKQVVGKEVDITVFDGGDHTHEEHGNVISLSYVSRKGPCLVTDHGDFAVDHVMEIRAA